MSPLIFEAVTRSVRDEVMSGGLATSLPYILYEMSLEDYEHWEGSVVKKEKLYGMRLMDLADQQSGLTLVMCPTEAKFSNEPSSSIWDDIRNAPLVRSELMRSDSRAQAVYFEEPRFISGMIQIFYKC